VIEEFPLGITVCARWQGPDGFANFIPDMGRRPRGKKLDRKNPFRLISKLDDSFGTNLDQKDQNNTVSAVRVLKDYLNKDFKCSDEPRD
jgi:hypothetical protein